jgi:hypothetical protein
MAYAENSTLRLRLRAFPFSLVHSHTGRLQIFGLKMSLSHTPTWQRSMGLIVSSIRDRLKSPLLAYAPWYYSVHHRARLSEIATLSVPDRSETASSRPPDTGC